MFFIFGGGLLFALPAAAQNGSWYKVEMIVFAHARGEYLNSQQWPAITGLSWQNAHNFGQQSPYFKALPRLDKLLQAKKRLENSKRYTVIYSAAWQQLTARKSVRLKIESPRFFQMPAVESGAKKLLEKETITKTAPQKAWQLEGAVELTLSRFLHFNADLIYRAPVYSNTSFDRQTGQKNIHLQLANKLDASAYLQGFRLNSSRKINSRDVHHIDHPMFGVLLLVEPL